MLLANPRWEQRHAKFLEPSGVGRVMADGTDENGAHAARMDECVAWETVEGQQLGVAKRLNYISTLVAQPTFSPTTQKPQCS